MSIDKMIEASVRCLKCGAGYMECDCWEKCSCGWFKGRGKPCNNQECPTLAVARSSDDLETDSLEPGGKA